MSVSLSKGGNVSLSKQAPGLTAVVVGLGWDPRTTTGADFDLDASAIMLDMSGRVLSDNHFVFFNNLKSPDGSVEHMGDNLTGGAEGDGEGDGEGPVEGVARPGRVDRGHRMRRHVQRALAVARDGAGLAERDDDGARAALPQRPGRLRRVLRITQHSDLTCAHARRQVLVPDKHVPDLRCVVERVIDIDDVPAWQAEDAPDAFGLEHLDDRLPGGQLRPAARAHLRASAFAVEPTPPRTFSGAEVSRPV